MDRGLHPRGGFEVTPSKAWDKAEEAGILRDKNGVPAVAGLLRFRGHKEGCLLFLGKTQLLGFWQGVFVKGLFFQSSL